MGYPWVGRRRERAVLKICERHLDKVLEAVDALKELIYAFVGGDEEKVREVYDKLFALEREADDIKEEIIMELSRGPFHPIDREDILRLVVTSDDIAAHAKAAGRKLTFLKTNNIPADIKDGMKRIVDLAVECVLRLKVAFDRLVSSPKDAIAEAEKVERVEEEVDEVRADLIEKVLTWGDEVKLVSRWLLVKEVIEDIETLTDKAEDTADVVRSLAVLS